MLVIPGSRGGAAGALRLDYHVDDSRRNCIDVKSESGAKPLLIVDPSDEIAARSARKLGIGTAESISQCLDILDQATLALRNRDCCIGSRRWWGGTDDGLSWRSGGLS